VAAGDEEIAAARAAGALPVRIGANGGEGDVPLFGNLAQFSDALLTGRFAIS